MKLTGKLKDKVDAVESMDAKKSIIEEAGMELSDDELDVVTGGVNRRNPGGPGVAPSATHTSGGTTRAK